MEEVARNIKNIKTELKEIEEKMEEYLERLGL